MGAGTFNKILEIIQLLVNSEKKTWKNCIELKVANTLNPLFIPGRKQVNPFRNATGNPAVVYEFQEGIVRKDYVFPTVTELSPHREVEVSHFSFDKYLKIIFVLSSTFPYNRGLRGRCDILCSLYH